MIPVPRYSVCTPAGLFPHEILATNDRMEADNVAAETVGAIVYDWTIPGGIPSPWWGTV